MSIEHNTTLPFTFLPVQAGNATDVQPRVQPPGGRRSVQFAAKGSAFEVANGVTNVITKKSKSLVPPSPVQFRPIVDTDPKPTTRCKFNDMGSGPLKLSRDFVKCVTASFMEQLSAETSRQLAIERTMYELGEVIASDVSIATKEAYDRGVAQGQFQVGGPTLLKAADEVAKVREVFYSMQGQYEELFTLYQQQKAEIAHLQAVNNMPFTSGVHDFDADLTRIVDELDITELINMWNDNGSSMPDDSVTIAMLGDYVDSLPSPGAAATPNNSPIAPHRQFATLTPTALFT